MPKIYDTFVSAVLVSDEYSSALADKVKSVSKLLEKNYSNYEVLVVDNGVNFDELKKLKKILKLVSCIRIIRLAKVSDIDTAIFAGVESSIGDRICTLYNGDPIDLIVDFVKSNKDFDIVFGVASNLARRNNFEKIGSKMFYWYTRKFLQIDIPKGSTNFMCVNRNVANALTRTNRNVKHFRHLAKQIGFSSVNLNYKLPKSSVPYINLTSRQQALKAIDMVANYSSHPLRVLSYFGVIAGLLNVIYAIYVVLVNLSKDQVAEGWTTLSLQSSIMFFLLFSIMVVLSEYIGKILVETRKEQPYHIMQEISSTISLADETRRNVTK